jgi:cysteine desulfurase
MTLDDRGFQVGAGSPSTGRPEDPSPVLEEIGLPGTSGFRVGLGPQTTPDDVERFLSTLPEVVRELRQVERRSREAMANLRPPRGARS